MKSGLYYLENKPLETVIKQLKSQIIESRNSHGNEMKAMNVSAYRNVPTVVKNVPTLSQRKFWHHRLGHAPMKRIEKIQGLKGMNTGGSEVCLSCPLAKFTKLPYA